MEDADIEAGDTLVIRKGAEPKIGDIAATLDCRHEARRMI